MKTTTRKQRQAENATADTRVTAANVQAFADAIDADDIMPASAIDHETLYAFERALPKSALLKSALLTVLKDLLDHCNHFQRASVPGHANWYPHYLQLAARVARMIERK